MAGRGRRDTILNAASAVKRSEWLVYDAISHTLPIRSGSAFVRCLVHFRRVRLLLASRRKIAFPHVRVVVHKHPAKVSTSPLLILSRKLLSSAVLYGLAQVDYVPCPKPEVGALRNVFRTPVTRYAVWPLEVVRHVFEIQRTQVRTTLLVPCLSVSGRGQLIGVRVFAWHAPSMSDVCSPWTGGSGV